MPPRPSVIAPATQPYKVVPVTAGGVIVGTVDLEGTAPIAEVIRPSVDQKACGMSLLAKGVTLSGTRIGGAIVWLTDIRSGKAFPLEQRYELTAFDIQRNNGNKPALNPGHDCVVIRVFWQDSRTRRGRKFSL